MTRLRLLALFCLIGVTAGAGETRAEGFLSRLRSNLRSPVTPAQQYRPTQQYRSPLRNNASPRERYPARNLDRGRTRLPSGRSYYQGRYYGNFNNRFYGPQYGYF